MPALVTCRKNAPCAKGCYARNGNYKYPSVMKSHAENFAAYVESPTNYFDTVDKYIKKHKTEYFRWHGAGDIVDETYLKGMVKVAKNNPDTHFLAYTKQFEIVNKYLDKGYRFPKNLKVLFSNWDKNFNISNPYGRPMTFVKFKNAELTPELPVKGATVCPGSCENCKKCWELRKGQSVIFNQH